MTPNFSNTINVLHILSYIACVHMQFDSEITDTGKLSRISMYSLTFLVSLVEYQNQI